jgi:LuxR family maltose regulon positive regulatory protein
MVHVPLTRAHNRADVFLGALAAALAQEIGEALDPGGPPETVVVDLLNALAAMSGHLFIILDGYGVITAPVVHDAVSLMLDYLPPQVHVVIVTDVEPPLSNLPRLRVRRHMTRIKL